MALQTDAASKTLTCNFGGGFLTLFGLAFGSIGFVAVIQLLTGGDVTVNGRPGTPGDSWIPGIFALIGAAVAFSRYRVVVDLRRLIVSKRFSCVFPLHTKSLSIPAPARVTLSREVRRSQKSSTVVYPVRLVAGDQEIDLTASQSTERARRDAESVAALARVPLHDSSSGETLVREHDALDHSIVDLTTDEEAVPRPSDSRIQTEDRVSELVVHLPPDRGQLTLRALGLLILMPIPVGFWLFAWRPGLSELASQSVGGWLFAHAPLLMIGAVILGSVLTTIHGGILGQTLLVDSQGVRVTNHLRSTRIAKEQLEELRVVTGGRRAGVMARSDHEKFLCGQGLSEADHQHLRSLILQRLRGGRS